MPRDFEIAVQRRNTDAQIKEDGESIILSRVGGLVEDGAGGYTGGTSGPIPAQQFVLETTNRQLPIRRTVDGMEISPEYVMTGFYDADVKAGDWFFKDGIKYEVVFVHLDRSYQTTVEVMYRG